jgi:hypothetical protein
MSLAPLVITAVIVEGRSKTSVARDYGITRFWVQTLVKRFQVQGDAALQPYSRRPHGLAPRSVRKYHVMLHSIFQRAVRDQLILTNPCEHTELPKVVLRRSSPLITLAAVFVAFAIMFTVDMLSGPPGKSSAGTADAPVGSARGSASTGSPSPPRPPSSRISLANASTTKDGLAAIAAVFGNHALAISAMAATSSLGFGRRHHREEQDRHASGRPASI